MKVHTLSRAQLQFMAVAPLKDYELCIFEAEEGDKWKGFIAARAGWNGKGLLPCEPMISFAMALHVWVRQLKGLPDAH